MAAKEMEMKKQPQKETSKKKRRLKRSVRKTLGALFLASSIAVAAIPTNNFQVAASDGNVNREGVPSYSTDSSARIPQIDKNTKIYTDENRIFRFAYLNDGRDDVAVILGYSSLTLVNGELEIPERVDAYAKFTTALGTDRGYVAVGKNGNFLFWKETRKEVVTDEDGNIVYEDPKDPDDPKEEKIPKYKYVDYYNPCYADTKNQWGDIDYRELYYDKSDEKGQNPGVDLTAENAVQTTDPNFQRIQRAVVAYIGNQCIKQDKDGNWGYDEDVTFETREKGVFAENGNIRKLIVHDTLLGIGDYAFYRCGYLDSISLANGLNTIGNGAFYDCTNMASIQLDIGSNLNQIGARAFYNCQKLASFTLPIQVSRIGDSAFEGCTSLKMVDLNSAGNFNQLTELGRDLFKNCEALESLTFPDKCTADVYLSSFEGCRSLKFISTRNSDISFVEELGVYTYDQFKAMLSGTPVNGAFYFEGMEDSDLHKMAKENCFAFSYIDYYAGVVTPLDKYELTVQEKEGAGEVGRATYVVNSSKKLISYNAGDKVDTITVPGQIGGIPINYIAANTFANNCYVIKVEIPANVREIESEAFLGCHNLEDVIFESEDVKIGNNAFKTQATQSHQKTCPDGGKIETDQDQTPTVKLKFTGPISSSSGPFKYAMSKSGNYSADSQKAAFITYYSGWPQNLEIQYNSSEGISELVNFPSLKDLTSNTYNRNKYKYLTKDQEAAIVSAAQKYQKGDEMTTLEEQLIDAVMHIVIPEGVESVKDGLFYDKEDTGTTYNKEKKTITAYSLQKITRTAESDPDDPDHKPGTGTFAGCTNYSSISLLGGVTSLDDYAFAGCTELTSVTLPATLTEVGLRPFVGCSSLRNVNFGGGPYFECDNGIIYDLKNNTKKIVECLEGRNSPSVGAAELAGVTGLYPEAFMGAPVMEVDLSQTTVTAIPERAFMNTDRLMSVTLPRHDPKTISKDAFKNSSIIRFTIPGKMHTINPEAFSGDTDLRALWFYCEADSMARSYADEYGIQWTETKPEIYHNVVFGYYDSSNIFQQIGLTQEVLEGGEATPPKDEEVPKKPGYQFTGWLPTDYLAVYKDLQIVAQYTPESDVFYTITYYHDDYTVYMKQRVQSGYDAIVPVSPDSKINPGAEFQGWVLFGGDHSGEAPEWTNIQDNMSVIAVFKGSGGGPGASVDPDDPNATKDPNATNDPNATKDPNATNDPNSTNGPGNGTSGKFYTLTVQNGSGSGSYLEGSQPIIIANDPASGQEFDYWSVSPADVKIASTVLSASIVTMPAGDVTVTAHFKTKSGSSSDGSAGGSSSTPRPNGNSGSVNKGGTTIVIDKNGLSNTGVVSATVNGSSDNFTIKISESAVATEAALRALMAAYGDNLDNIKFFPMDISLYDSTGTTKITDTTGLSVSITLPLPDSLITYAGNNRVASVVNDRLEKLSARFSTIQGVSCITFTAEHFSPYVIYVNTGDLSSGLVSDSTPKTGDFIHPKWFLSIALACLSFVFFIQKDTRKEKKVKVKVKA